MKIWFQNRRTKWKKHENITATDISDQKLQNEKNPDVTKAIQNAAKLKKAKERSEQTNHAVVSSKPQSDNNSLPENIERFSIPRYAADDTSEFPLCLVQEKTVPGTEKGEKDTKVIESRIKIGLPDENTNHITNHDYELGRPDVYKKHAFEEHTNQPQDLSANNIEIKVDMS